MWGPLYNDWEWNLQLETQIMPSRSVTVHHDSKSFDHAFTNLSFGLRRSLLLSCTTLRVKLDSKPFFTREILEAWMMQTFCVPCDCDPRGSLEMESVLQVMTHNGAVAGKFHWQLNCWGTTDVQMYMRLLELPGRTIPWCWSLFLVTNWERFGTLECDVVTGECVCNETSFGRDCNQCDALPEFMDLDSRMREQTLWLRWWRSYEITVTSLLVM